MAFTLEQAQGLHGRGKFEEAEAAYRDVLSREPGNLAAVHLLGLLLFQHGRAQEGIPLIEQSLRMAPDAPQLFFNYGNVLLQQRRPADAATAFRRAIELQPDFPDALNNLSVALSQQGDFENAAVVARLVLARRASSTDALHNLAQAHRGMGERALVENRARDAVKHFQEVLHIFAHHPEGRLGLARALAALDDPGAHQALLSAIDTGPNEPPPPAATYELARWLDRHGRGAEAVSYLEQTVALDPSHADAHADLAAILGEQGRVSEAIEHAQRAMALRPDHPAAAITLGAVLSLAGRHSEGAQVLSNLIERRGLAWLDGGAQGAAARANLAVAMSNLLLMMHYDEPFEPERVFQQHTRFGEIFDRPLAPALPADGGKLRIGYVSSDFRRHSVAFFIEPLIARHDRSRFDVLLYSASTIEDDITARLKGYEVTWRNIAGVSDADAAAMIRADGIHILVDLGGHTGGNRLPLFGLKPAPVQVTYLGYPDTTGLRSIHWRITDAIADPEGAERFHAEKLYRLPRAAWCYRPFEKAPAVAAPPSESLGHITFGCFNTIRKVGRATAAMWTRVLLDVPNSRLILKARELRDERARAQIMETLAAAGAPLDRVELRRPEPVMEAHLAAYDDIDIALDPFPYNGTTTTCDALWMGVPVITLAGTSHLSRVSASLLHAVGLDNLVARTPEEYVRRAAELAGDAGRLRELRKGLRDQMRNSPLCDETGFARAMERAYEQMWA